MGSESPDVVLYDASGNPLAVAGGTAVPTSSIMVAGSDGTNLRFIATDSSGHQIIVGDGVAGTPAGGVVSIQGVSGGTNLPVSQGTTPWTDNITQFGGVALSTGTGASGTGIPRVTVANDSNILATQSGIWTVQPGNTANTTPWLVTNQVLDVTQTGALGALNANVQLTLQGHTSTAFQLATGTLVGTIVAETSADNGTTWNVTQMDTGNKVSSIVFGSANTATFATIVGVGGSGLVRIRVSVYTSGTANITLRASVINDPSVNYAGIPLATTQPPTAAQIAGWDGTTLRVPAVLAGSTAPVVGNQAMVVVISPNQTAIPVSSTPLSSAPGIAQGYVQTSATTNVQCSATVYTEQTTNFTGSIKSSSAADAAAGTGARTVIINYVDQTGATAGSETVTLNGTTAVNLVTTTKCFIERIEVLTVGSGGTNAGIISLFNAAAGGGTLVTTIAAGDNRTYHGHHYVISGQTCNITGMTGFNSSTSNQTIFTIQAQTIPTANQASVQVSDWVTGYALTQALRTYGSLIKVPGPARVQLYSAPGGTPSIKSQGSFDYYDQ